MNVDVKNHGGLSRHFFGKEILTKNEKVNSRKLSCQNHDGLRQAIFW